MKISLAESTWTLSSLSELEFRLLEAVPSAADPGESDKAQDRLFPPPIRNPDPEDADFTQEWNAYVTGDLITGFRDDLSTYSSDLRRAEVTGEDEEGKPVRTLEVSLSHGANWFSALNQARLVMAEVHDIYNEDGQIYPREDEDFGDFHQRWRLYVQSNYYAGIQEWLVENVLPGL